MSGRFILSNSIVLLLIASCAPELRKQMPICPGKQSVSDSLNTLQSYAKDAKNIKANGQCLAELAVDGKIHRENFPVKIWYNVPSEIRIHGDIAFNPKGLDIGSNKDEFWIAMKPKELGSSYFWGKWAENADFSGVNFGPKMFIESFGLIEINEGDDWVLLNNEGTDILSRCDNNGKITKKIYIYNCDYRIRKIVYFGNDENPAASVELDDYRDIDNGALVPQRIHITHFNNDGTKDSFKIKLSSVKTIESYSAKQQRALFSRPESKGFGDIYKVVNGEVIKQPW